MHIQDYLSDKGIKQVWLARKLGVNPVTLHRWIQGKHEVPLKIAQEIEALTDGQVTVNDW